jgi:hypothetical protein
MLELRRDKCKLKKNEIFCIKNITIYTFLKLFEIPEASHRCAA